MAIITPQEYLANKGKVSTIKKVTNQSSIISPAQYMAGKGIVTQPKPTLGKKAVSSLRWIGKQVMKPVSTVAVGAEQIGKAIGTQSLSPFGEAPGKVADIWTGKTERSFSDIWKENLPGHETAGTIIGTFIDITADPLNFIGGGLTKVGKVAQKATSLAKGGQKISRFPAVVEKIAPIRTALGKAGLWEAKSLDEQIKTLGLTAKELELGATKAEQALKGQRAFLQYAGKPILKAEQSAKIYEKTANVMNALNKTATIQKVKGLITNKTTNVEFNSFVESLRDAGKYKEAQLLEDSKKLSSFWVKLTPEQKILFTNAIDAPELNVGKKVSKEITDAANFAKKNYAQWGNEEVVAGLRKHLIKTYGARMIEKPTITGTIKQGFQDFITRAKGREVIKPIESVKSIYGKGTKEFSTGLGFSGKHRNIMKFVGEDGKELVGTADYLGLKKVKMTKSVKGVEKPAVEPLAQKIKNGIIFKDKNGLIYQAKQVGQVAAEKATGVKFKPPVVSFAGRGAAHIKAMTGADFMKGVTKFAVEHGVEVTAPELKGLKFEPDVAKVIDTYWKSIQPEELGKLMKTYDSMLNWWKGQALLSPAYHLRNAVSNLWNNFLAGVTNPMRYEEAMQIQRGKAVKVLTDAGEILDSPVILEMAKKHGILGSGWYAGDIVKQMEEIVGKTNLNPLSNRFKLFQLNRRAGTAIENNARLALFIDQLKKGYSAQDAAMTVKKFLFDYGDLTTAEKTMLKRVMPFYTWTRKNIPLQLEQMVAQPGKFAGVEKVVKAIETIGMGNAPAPDEKYLANYIKDNTAMRVSYDPEEQTYYYFLLGNWLPSYQAIDFLSQPIENIAGMLTPFAKTPFEIISGKSTFWKDTLNSYEAIENVPGETTNFLGLNMPKRTALVLRNIRLLNEIDKLNLGDVFGGEKGTPSVAEKAGLPAVNIPGAGIITPAKYKYAGQTPVPTNAARIAGLFLGKLQANKPSYTKKIYQSDTENRVRDLKNLINQSARKGDKKRVEILKKQLKEFIQSRK